MDISPGCSYFEIVKWHKDINGVVGKFSIRSYIIDARAGLINEVGDVFGK